MLELQKTRRISPHTERELGDINSSARIYEV